MRIYTFWFYKSDKYFPKVKIETQWIGEVLYNEINVESDVGTSPFHHILNYNAFYSKNIHQI